MKRYFLYGVLALGLAACKDPLFIENQNNPDRDRVFNNPTDLEQFIAGLYAVQHAATIGGSNTGVHTQMLVMGMENHSNLANFAMGPRGQIPRNPITNARGSQGGDGNYHDWFRGHRAARQAALALAALDRLGTLGSGARDRRARAFCRFIQGVALANLSLVYDSASILTENDNPTADASLIVPLSHYSAVNAAALGYLDSAIAIARTATASTELTTFLPDVANLWINGGAVSRDNFIRIVKGYKARFRANVARTPAERAAVNWAAVIADADSAITADLRPKMDPTNGWDLTWVVQHYATGAANWHQLSQFWLGMADTTHSGTVYAYDTWLATPRASKDAFLVVTPDRRFPRGTQRGTLTTAGTQVANSPGPGGTGQNSPIPWDSVPYIRNRPSGEDQPGEPLQKSMYDFYRSRSFRNASRIGVYPVMTRAEIRLLAAEGNLRLGNFAAAAARIDSSRVTIAALPSVAGIVDTLTPVPGGTACVPRVPDAAFAYQLSKCGNIWDALKWEYRLETMYTGYGNWFFVGRGWGDLPEGTAVHWPVPYQEMDTRVKAFYSAGGVGAPTGAAKGNYGLFAGIGGLY